MTSIQKARQRDKSVSSSLKKSYRDDNDVMANGEDSDADSEGTEGLMNETGATRARELFWIKKRMI